MVHLIMMQNGQAFLMGLHGRWTDLNTRSRTLGGGGIYTACCRIRFWWYENPPYDFKANTESYKITRIYDINTARAL